MAPDKLENRACFSKFDCRLFMSKIFVKAVCILSFSFSVISTRTCGLVGRTLASCPVGRGSRQGRTQTLKLELPSVWPSAPHHDCSRETLQCDCNLRRSPVVLPLAIPSEQLRQSRENGRSLHHPKQISAPAIVEGTRRTIVVLLPCVQCLQCVE